MTALTVPTTRQWPLAAYVDFSFSDMVGSTAVELFAVPAGSILTYMSLYTTTAFAGGTTHDCDIGDITDPDEYSTTIIELDGTAGLPTNKPTLSGYKTTTTEPKVLLTPISTGGDPTSGVGYVFATYIVVGRSNENYEY